MCIRFDCLIAMSNRLSISETGEGVAGETSSLLHVASVRGRAKTQNALIMWLETQLDVMYQRRGLLVSFKGGQ
jgi:hypothetical protein